MSLKRAMFICVSIFLLVSTSSYAGRFVQSAYITNAFFTLETFKGKYGYQHPKEVINVIQANQKTPNLKFIANMLFIDKGEHVFTVEVKTGNGKTFHTIPIAAIIANAQDMPFIIVVALDQVVFPKGNAFLKLIDNYGGEEKIIGVFRVVTK
jgi:hypothetical protein